MVMQTVQGRPSRQQHDAFAKQRGTPFAHMALLGQVCGRTLGAMKSDRQAYGSLLSFSACCRSPWNVASTSPRPSSSNSCG